MALLIYVDGSSKVVTVPVKNHRFTLEQIEEILGAPTQRWNVSHPVGPHLFVRSEWQLLQDPRAVNKRATELCRCPMYGTALICGCKEYRVPKDHPVARVSELVLVGAMIDQILDPDLSRIHQRNRSLGPQLLSVQILRNLRKVKSQLPVVQYGEIPQITVHLPAKKSAPRKGQKKKK